MEKLLCQRQTEFNSLIKKWDQTKGKNMKSPVHIGIIDKIPGYSQATPKRDKRKIKEIMYEYEYDDDYIKSISDDFCQGWDTAKNIITNMLSDRYWRVIRGRQTRKRNNREGDVTSK